MEVSRQAATHSPMPQGGTTPDPPWNSERSRDDQVHGRKSRTARGPIPTHDPAWVATGIYRVILPTPAVGRRPEWRPACAPEGQHDRHAAAPPSETGGTARGPFPTPVQATVNVHGWNFVREQPGVAAPRWLEGGLGN
jgi:hypothetical protein